MKKAAKLHDLYRAAKHQESVMALPQIMNHLDIKSLRVPIVYSKISNNSLNFYYKACLLLTKWAGSLFLSKTLLILITLFSVMVDTKLVGGTAWEC